MDGESLRFSVKKYTGRYFGRDKMGQTWLLIGAPAAGKSTFSYNLKSRCKGIKQFSVRLHTQKLILEHDSLGQFIEKKGYIEKKEFIPDSVVGEVFDDFVKRLSDDDFLLIEGFPINNNQFRFMTDSLDYVKRKVDGIIIVQTDVNVLKERILLRKVCRKCELKNTGGVPIPQNANKCPYCGGILEKRIDDNLETFEKRYELFVREKENLLKWMPNEKVVLVDGNSGMHDQIIEEMIERINGKTI